MSANEPPRGEVPPGRFEHLSQPACMELLATKQVGRVAYCAAAGPVVLPVTYAVRDHSVIFRTTAGSTLAKFMKDQRAAFQVDEIDDLLQAGWSVLVAGTASWVVDTEDLSDLWMDRHQPDPWAAGERNAFVRIVPSTITGRRVHPG